MQQFLAKTPVLYLCNKEGLVDDAWQSPSEIRNNKSQAGGKHGTHSG